MFESYDYNNTPNIDGFFIKKLRSDLSYSLDKFAKLFNVSSTSVQQWEKNEMLPDTYKQIVMLQLRKRIDDEKQEKIGQIVMNILVAGGIIALFTYLFSKND